MDWGRGGGARMLSREGGGRVSAEEKDERGEEGKGGSAVPRRERGRKGSATCRAGRGCVEGQQHVDQAVASWKRGRGFTREEGGGRREGREERGEGGHHQCRAGREEGS